jgi:PEP-CTERM motif
MRKLLLLGATALAVALGVTSALAQSAIGIRIFEDGVLLSSSGFVTGGFQSLTINNSDFSVINVTATGSPLTPFPDFGSISTNISSAAFTGTHTLTILATQIGIQPGDPNVSFLNSYSTNFLAGAPNVGSVSFSNFVSPVNAAFAQTLNIGGLTTFTGGAGGELLNLPGFASLGGLGLYSETTVMSAVFNGGLTNIQTTDQITGVPEPATWGMMLLGFAGLGFAFRRKLTAKLA